MINIVSPTLLNEPGLRIDGQAGATSIVVASKNRVQSITSEDGGVAAASSRFEVVVFNYTTLDRIGL